jgi:SNF2 family DNA or RNA helicase
MNRNHKILVFSNSDESFNIITKKMKDLKHKHLKGTSSHIANVINEFKTSDLNLLFMNAKHFGAGLNIENATDIIFYHEMDKDLETQIIGRAQRMGRIGQLNIWRFKY